MASRRISTRSDALVSSPRWLTDLTIGRGSATTIRTGSGRAASRSIGELAQALLDSQVLENALPRLFGAREKAVEAQHAAMQALNLPSAGDLERLERRLRSFSQRLEEVEDQLDRTRARRDWRDAQASRLTLNLRVRVPPRRALPARFSADSRRSSSRTAREPTRPSTKAIAAAAISELRRPGRGRRRSACRRPRARSRQIGGARRRRVEAGDAARARRRRRAPRQRRGQLRGRARPSRRWRRRRRRPSRRRRSLPRPGSGSPGSEPSRGRPAAADPDRPAHPELGQVGEDERGARPADPGRLDRQRAPRRSHAGVAPEAAGVVAHLRLARAAPGRAAGPAPGRRRGSRQWRMRLWGAGASASSIRPYCAAAPFAEPSSSAPPRAPGPQPAVRPRGPRSSAAPRACASTRRRSSCRSRRRRRASWAPRVSTVG